MTANQSLIERFAAANGDELVEILYNPSPTDAATLRQHLGEDQYRRMRTQAIQVHMVRDDVDSDTSHNREHVLIVPGLLGTKLISVDGQGEREQIWLDADSILQGKLMRLQLAPGGQTQLDPAYKIEVGGVMKRYYGELMLALARSFRVETFAYDWRKSLRSSAAQLNETLLRQYTKNDVVHLVAVGEGGMLVRLWAHTYGGEKEGGVNKYPQGRMLFLGSPLYGSFAFLQVLAGHNPLVSWAAMVDPQHNPDDFQKLVRSMPSMYELLPSPLLNKKEWAQLYDIKTYGPTVGVDQTYLPRCAWAA